MQFLFVVFEQDDSDKFPSIKQVFMTESDAIAFTKLCGSPTRKAWVETYTVAEYCRTIFTARLLD